MLTLQSAKRCSPRTDTELNAFKVIVEFLIFNTPLPYYFIIPSFSVTEFPSHQSPTCFLQSHQGIASFLD